MIDRRRKKENICKVATSISHAIVVATHGCWLTYRWSLITLLDATRLVVAFTALFIIFHMSLGGLFLRKLTKLSAYEAT